MQDVIVCCRENEQSRDFCCNRGIRCGQGRETGVCKENQKEGVMIARRFAWLPCSVACLTVLLYVGLVALTAGCVSMPVSPSGSHHHSQESTHSPLCAWSCQMVSQTGLVASAPTLLVSLVVVSEAVPLVHSPSIAHSIPRPARAPPVFTLV